MCRNFTAIIWVTKEGNHMETFFGEVVISKNNKNNSINRGIFLYKSYGYGIEENVH